MKERDKHILYILLGLVWIGIRLLEIEKGWSIVDIIKLSVGVGFVVYGGYKLNKNSNKS